MTVFRSWTGSGSLNASIAGMRQSWSRSGYFYPPAGVDSVPADLLLSAQWPIGTDAQAPYVSRSEGNGDSIVYLRILPPDYGASVTGTKVDSTVIVIDRTHRELATLHWSRTVNAGGGYIKGPGSVNVGDGERYEISVQHVPYVMTGDSILTATLRGTDLVDHTIDIVYRSFYNEEYVSPSRDPDLGNQTGHFEHGSGVNALVPDGILSVVLTGHR